MQEMREKLSKLQNAENLSKKEAEKYKAQLLVTVITGNPHLLTVKRNKDKRILKIRSRNFKKKMRKSNLNLKINRRKQ
jgi:diaminopimelate epimerase